MAMTRANSFAEHAVDVAKLALLDAGFAPDGLRVLRMGDRAVMRQEQAGIIARVERSEQRFEAAEREVQVARWLNGEGISVQLPLEGDQPQVVEDLPVSLWHAVDGEWTVPSELARMLRRLHTLTPPDDLVLPQLDPFERVDERIEHAAIAGPHGEKLRSVADKIRHAYSGLNFELGRTVLHGDANIGNILQLADGGVVLFDLGGMCWGPPEWDLTITAVYRDLGWHTSAEYEAFCDAYGYDITTWHGYPALRATRELRMTCWLSQKAGDDDEIRREVIQRIDDLTEPDRQRSWHPY